MNLSNSSDQADHKVKLNSSDKRNKFLDFARELKKTMEYESDGVTNCNWQTRYSPQKFGTGTGGFGNERTSGYHLSYCIVDVYEVFR